MSNCHAFHSQRSYSAYSCQHGSWSCFVEPTRWAPTSLYHPIESKWSLKKKMGKWGFRYNPPYKWSLLISGFLGSTLYPCDFWWIQLKVAPIRKKSLLICIGLFVVKHHPFRSSFFCSHIYLHFVDFLWQMVRVNVGKYTLHWASGYINSFKCFYLPQGLLLLVKSHHFFPLLE